MKLKIICEYCKQEFNSKKSCYKHKHEIHHIKNGQAPKYDLTCKFCGYTNYITKAGMTLHQKYCKLNPDKIICIGHPVSDATKNKISNGMHIAALEGRNKGWTTSRLGENRKSYPEEFFTKVIENEFENKNYQYNYPFYTWKLDFAWIDKKKCIEIDGSQHEEQKQKESDIRKDKKLIEEGWQVLRIKWKDLFNEPKKYINKANSFIVIDDQ